MGNLLDFIQMAVGQLGIPEGTARGATGGILNLLKQTVGGADFEQLLTHLSGAEGLMKEARGGRGEEGSTGEGLGGLLSTAASAVGGGGGGALGLAGLLTQSGLEAGQIGSFVSMFLGFAKQHVGGDLINRLLDQVPEIKILAR